MTVLCRVALNDRETHDVSFQTIPRVGESVSLPISGEAQILRVTRILHVPKAGQDNAQTVVEVTDKLL